MNNWVQFHVDAGHCMILHQPSRAMLLLWIVSHELDSCIYRLIPLI